MPILVVEHSGKRTTATLNGRTTIGRTPNNDVVIEHPAVSRTHAIIDCIDNSFFISDGSSKNGTLVGDKPISGKRELGDGDRIAIGPAVITFRVDDDPNDQTSKSSLSETHAGMLMDCECGAKLWVPKEMIGGRGQCQKCGRTLTLGQQAKPAVAHTCSICQWKIDPTDEQHTCPSCGLVFHTECWNDNRGCSAYGCPQVNALDKPEEVSAAMEEIGHPPIIVTPHQKFPWEFTLVATSVVAAFVGSILFGVPALLTLLASGKYLLKHGKKSNLTTLLAAMGISLVGLVVGVVVSCFWWFNLRLHRG
jgi:hypothetical protein